MRKLHMTTLAIMFYVVGIIGFDSNQSSQIYAAELDESTGKNISQNETVNDNMGSKSLALKDKSNEFKRFTDDKANNENAKKNNNDETRTVQVEATAYTASCDGCSGTTYTGINLKANPDRKVIAVDPDVIPLGSKVKVPGYGTAIAGDIGGDIQGNRIDVFIPQTNHALDFGRQQLEVEIIES
ncbi:3D domain-containing protein [Thalassobacillus sp. CUG 92003]|uniref:3D domain-containing protein n=1 Tax=Thalassobacillus sp. CUG 92003 TaxID=2736641 RepID=UPI0015E67C12